MFKRTPEAMLAIYYKLGWHDGKRGTGRADFIPSSVLTDEQVTAEYERGYLDGMAARGAPMRDLPPR
jgi:hypothetical protein